MPYASDSLPRVWKHWWNEGLGRRWAGGGFFGPCCVLIDQFGTHIVASYSHTSTLSELLGFRRVDLY
jgi:hypothetical protein